MGDLKQNSSSIEDAYPVTMLQAGMLFHSEFSNKSSVYHDIFTYSFHGPYDFAMLKAAAEQLVSRHAVLRTSINISDFSEPLQLVHSKVNLSFDEKDLRSCPSVDRREIVKQWVENEKKRKFNWEKAPLFRLQSHCWSEEEFDISVSFHHSILDGWSVAKMMTEFTQLYLWKLGYAEDTLIKNVNVKFREFVALEKKALQSEECKNYWLTMLQDSSFTRIPRWPLKEKQNVYHSLHRDIPQEISEGLLRLSRLEGVPLKNLLLAVHVRVISLISGERDVVTGVVSNGRPEKFGGEDALGLFLNTLPLRVKLSNETWREFIRRLFEQEQDMWPYRRYPLAAIQIDLRNTLLFETAFNYVNFHVYKDGGASSKPLVIVGFEGFEQTNFPFLCQFSVNPSNNGVHFQLTYDASQFSSNQIEAIQGYYLKFLRLLLAETDKPYLQSSVVSDQEYHHLVSGWKV